jgi:site-specific DNA-cytosine methylase
VVNAVSLFAGVGGIDLALQRNGIDVVAAVEIDPAARGVLRHRFPNTQLFNDVRTVTGDELIAAGFNPTDGIIVGGFPCQDLSVAGKRAGLDGTRSGLFWEIIRLVDELSPKWLVLENVPGLLSSNGGRDMGTVVGALVERGYGVAYRVLDAQHFGVPQRRRVVIVGCFGNDGRTPGEILATSEGRERHLAESATKGSKPSPATARSTVSTLQGGGDRGYRIGTEEAAGNQLVVTPYVKVIRSGARAEDGSLPAEVWAEQDIAPTLNQFDNGSESRATVLLFENSRRDGIRIQGDTSATLQGFMGTGGGNVPMIHAIQNTVIGRNDQAGPQGKGYADDGEPMFTIDTTSPHAVAFHQTQDPISGKVSPALGATSGGMGILTSVVRRLTPTECERLQGFPTIFTWSDDMTRDELCAALLANGYVTVDKETGRVYRHRGPGGRSTDPVIVEGSIVNGYLVATFHLASIRRQIRLHRLVWISGNGIPVSGLAVCHRNNTKTDNRLENLYLATPEDNTRDAHRDGLIPHNGLSLIERQELVFDRRDGSSIRELIEKYGIQRSRVYGILKDDGWTAQKWDEKKQVVVDQADSARYKQMGNAVAVPVFEWVIGRLVAHVKAGQVSAA